MNGVRVAMRNFWRSPVVNRTKEKAVANIVHAQQSSATPWGAIAATAAASATLGITFANSHAFAESPSTSKQPDMWDRWDQVKGFLTGWKKVRGVSTDVPLPTDKLACRMPKGGLHYEPVVLVACGSFNPPTVMHLRMLELARQELVARGYDVLGAYISPVADAYWKKDLAPGGHRLQMCHVSTLDSDFVMVDAWEVEQPQYTRTLHVLQHLKRRLMELFEGENNIQTIPQGCPPTAEPRTVLVCGADVLQSMADASIWKQDLLETLLSEHGVVCITRDGAGVSAEFLLSQPGTLLYKYRENVILVHNSVVNEVSSSAVRKELEAGRSIRYLVWPGVEEYIKKHGLYGTGHKK